jgi:hypothetical protein
MVDRQKKQRLPDLAVVRIEEHAGNWELVDITPDFLEKKQRLIDAATYTLETPKEATDD